jgi:hypothetical protein
MSGIETNERAAPPTSKRHGLFLAPDNVQRYRGVT